MLSERARFGCLIGNKNRFGNCIEVDLGSPFWRFLKRKTDILVASGLASPSAKIMDHQRFALACYGVRHKGSSSYRRTGRKTACCLPRSILVKKKGQPKRLPDLSTQYRELQWLRDLVRQFERLDRDRDRKWRIWDRGTSNFKRCRGRS